MDFAIFRRTCRHARLAGRPRRAHRELRDRFRRTLANFAAAIRVLPHILIYDNGDLGRPFRFVRRAGTRSHCSHPRAVAPRGSSPCSQVGLVGTANAEILALNKTTAAGKGKLAHDIDEATMNAASSLSPRAAVSAGRVVHQSPRHLPARRGRQPAVRGLEDAVPRRRPAEMLFDLEADPGEMQNLAGAARLAGELERHRQLLTQWTTLTEEAKYPVPAAAKVARPKAKAKRRPADKQRNKTQVGPVCRTGPAAANRYPCRCQVPLGKRDLPAPLWPVSRPVRLLLPPQRWRADFRDSLRRGSCEHGLLPELQLGLHPLDNLRVLRRPCRFVSEGSTVRS